MVNLGEVRGDQLTKSTLLISSLGPLTLSDLSRSVQMLKREWGAESNGKLPHLFIPDETANLFLEFAVKYLPFGQNTLMVMMMIIEFKGLRTALILLMLK